MAALRINPHIEDVVCSKTGVSAGSLDRPLGLCACCPSPGLPLLVRYAFDAMRSDGGRATARAGRGLWRHAPLLPVLDVPPGYAEDVGDTASSKLDALGSDLGVEVWVKNEATNPTGSFKDRGLAVAVALCKATGGRRLCLPTQGNAGVAAPFFSRRMGLAPCVVYMPRGYEGSVYHRAAVHFGAEVAFAGANIAAAGKQMRADHGDALASSEMVDVSTFFEPGRLEGKKTMGIEIVETFGTDALPDYVFYPTGGGTGLVGIWKAFEELSALGRIDPSRHALPKLIAVQSEQCAPVVRAFERGLDHVEPVESRGTIADGLDVPGAIMGHEMLRSIRASGGFAMSVPEGAIRAAFAQLGGAGINAGYEAAATLAALRAARETNRVPGGARVLLLNTGSHLIALARS